MPEPEPKKTPQERAVGCAKCIVCCPCNFTVSCVTEVKDTIIYFAQCPARCRDDSRRAAEKRKEKGMTRQDECVHCMKDCVTPEEGCCGETEADPCVCCYISPKNWTGVCCFFAVFYGFVFSFFIALLLIYLAIASYDPFVSS